MYNQEQLDSGMTDEDLKKVLLELKETFQKQGRAKK